MNEIRLHLIFIKTKFADVAMYFCNQEEYGFMMRQLKMDTTIEDDYNEFLNVKLAGSGNVMRVG